jgi:hypothetical protein
MDSGRFSRMIHLALSIAAALFLIWVFFVGLAILAHTWKWVLGILAAIVLLLFIATRDHPANLQATHAPEAYRSNALPRTLPERLRVDPPLIASLPQGEAWFVSALPAQDQVRLVVSFHSNSATSMLESNATKSLPLLKQYLCGADGVLVQYALTSAKVLIVAYENDTRVGQVELPTEYCPRPGQSNLDKSIAK